MCAMEPTYVEQMIKPAAFMHKTPALMFLVLYQMARLIGRV